MIESFGQDLRFVIRQLRRAPAFAITSAVTLALGIGANTGIFSLINGFFRPLPVPFADRIVVIAADADGDESGFRYHFSYPALVDYRDQAQVFSDVFAFDTRIGGLKVDGKTSEFLFQAVSGNFFSGLGLVPAAGQFFRSGEGEHLGTERVMVLGYSCWRERFAGNPAVVGTVVHIDGEAARIVGVAPSGFPGLYEGAVMDGYLPLSALAARAAQPDRLFADRSLSYLTMLGRLRPGVSVSQAQAAVDIVARRLQVAYPSTDKGIAARVVPEPLARPIPLRFFGTIFPLIRTLLLTLATLVLLLACLNVTNLLFVRASVRQREMAVRAALGSSRARLVRLLLIESVVIAACGATVGVLLGRWSSAFVVRSIDIGMDRPVAIDVHFDWRVFSYALLTALATSLLIGLVPALRASRTRVTDVLHDGGRGGSAGAGRQRVRSALVIAQVAGSLVLLVVAGLFVRNLQTAQHIDLGFDPDQLLTMRMDPRQLGYDAAHTTTFYDELQRRVRALPGVDRAAFAFGVPMGYIFATCPVEPEGAPVTDESARPVVPYNSVGSDYFETMRLAIDRGRGFDDRDSLASRPVAIVNETLAARWWPGQDAIGKRFSTSCTSVTGQWTVVGVAHDSKYIAIFERQLPFFYLPLAQTQISLHVLQVRSVLPPGDLAARIRREVDVIDPEMPVADIRTMREALAGGLGFLMFRSGATQAAALGVLGLVLAVVGVYGVVSYGASQRVREIGIRLALGANPASVRWLVLRQGAVLVLAGVGVGLAGSIAVTSLIARFLVIGGGSNPLTFAVVTIVLCLIALVACDLPARRAMRVDPMVALRNE